MMTMSISRKGLFGHYLDWRARKSRNLSVRTCPVPVDTLVFARIQYNVCTRIDLVLVF